MNIKIPAIGWNISTDQDFTLRAACLRTDFTFPSEFHHKTGSNPCSPEIDVLRQLLIAL
jgi:hypothetical protein